MALQIPPELRKHEGALVALVAVAAAGVVVVRAMNANAAAASAAAAPSTAATTDTADQSSTGATDTGSSTAAASTPTAAASAGQVVTGPIVQGQAPVTVTPQPGQAVPLVGYQAPIGGTPFTGNYPSGSSLGRQNRGSAGSRAAPGQAAQVAGASGGMAPTVPYDNASDEAGINAYWAQFLPDLISGKMSPAAFGTVANDAGPTASLTGSEFAGTTLESLLTGTQAQQHLFANPQVAAATAAESNPGGLNTLYARANNLLNAKAAGQVPAGQAPALTADVASIQDAIVSSTLAAWGTPPAQQAQMTAAIVHGMDAQSRAAYNAAHGTSY